MHDFSRLKIQKMLNSTAELDVQSIQALFHADLMSDHNANVALSGTSTVPAKYGGAILDDFEAEANDKAPAMSLPDADPSASTDESS